MRVSILLLAAFFLVGACRKEKKYIVTGIVTDAYDGTSIAGATVKLYYRPLQGGVYSTNYSLYSSTTAASDGTYRLEFEKVVTSDFKFVVEATNSFPYEVVKNPDNLTDKEDNVINMKVYSSCTIQLHIKNVTPDTSTDQIVFKFISPNYVCTSCCNTNEMIFTGTSVDNTSTCQRYAKSYLRYQYIVTKSSGSNLFVDSVYCSKGTVVPVEILY